MSGLSGNKGLVRCLLLLWGIAIVATAGVSEGFNEFLELSPLESSFAATMGTIMLLDVVGAWVVDMIVQFAFPLGIGGAAGAQRSK